MLVLLYSGHVNVNSCNGAGNQALKPSDVWFPVVKIGVKQK